MVSAANYGLYSAIQPSNTSAFVFSVGTVPGREEYVPQAIVSAPTQNLLQTSLLGVAANAATADPWYLVTVDLRGKVTPIYQFPSGERLPKHGRLRQRRQLLWGSCPKSVISVRWGAAGERSSDRSRR